MNYYVIHHSTKLHLFGPASKTECEEWIEETRGGVLPEWWYITLDEVGYKLQQHLLEADRDGRLTNLAKQLDERLPCPECGAIVDEGLDAERHGEECQFIKEAGIWF